MPVKTVAGTEHTLSTCVRLTVILVFTCWGLTGGTGRDGGSPGVWTLAEEAGTEESCSLPPAAAPGSQKEGAPRGAQAKCRPGAEGGIPAPPGFTGPRPEVQPRPQGRVRIPAQRRRGVGQPGNRRGRRGVGSGCGPEASPLRLQRRAEGQWPGSEDEPPAQGPAPQRAGRFLQVGPSDTGGKGVSGTGSYTGPGSYASLICCQGC